MLNETLLQAGAVPHGVEKHSPGGSQGEPPKTEGFPSLLLCLLEANTLPRVSEMRFHGKNTKKSFMSSKGAAPSVVSGGSSQILAPSWCHAGSQNLLLAEAGTGVNSLRARYVYHLVKPSQRLSQPRTEEFKPQYVDVNQKGKKIKIKIP